MSDKTRYFIFDIIIPGWNQTISMFIAIMILSTILGLFFAIVLFDSSEVGLRPNKTLNTITGVIINILRSLPGTILIILLIPITRIILGRAIGETAGIFYLTIAAFPFSARMIESSLREVDRSVIEMGRSLGASDNQILMKIVVHDAVPSIVLGLTFTAILVAGYISIAGMVGAGGLGEIALLYGYRTYNHFIMNTCVLIMAVFAGLIQLIGNLLYRKLK